MKTFLLLILLTLSITSFSQIMVKDKPASTPGMELRKASNQFYTGMFLSIAGGAIIYASRNHVDKTIPQAGILISCVGVIVNLTSWIHINKAGKLLDKKLSASIGGNGILLKYSF